MRQRQVCLWRRTEHLVQPIRHDRGHAPKAKARLQKEVLASAPVSTFVVKLARMPVNAMLPTAIATRLEAAAASKPPPQQPDTPPDEPSMLIDAVTDYTSLLASPPSQLAAWPCSSASYHVTRLLGKGAFAACFAARKTSAWEAPSRVALKVLPRYSTKASRELEVNKLLRNAPGVAPRLFEFFYLLGSGDSKTCHLVMAMEAYDTDLRALLRRWAAAAAEHRPSWLHLARRAGQQLAPALAHLHGLGILHRDLKTDNCLVKLGGASMPSDDGAPPPTALRHARFVLSDFGHAKIITPSSPPHNNPQSTAYAFAPFFRAPELFFGCATYTSAPDVWALCCTLSEVLLGGAALFDPDDDDDGDGIPSSDPNGELSDAQRQLLALFDGLGTPSWPEVVAMNPALDRAESGWRMRAWMGMPPRPPTRPWAARLAEAIAEEEDDGAEAEAAIAMLGKVFVFEPEKRPTAASLSKSAFLL